jgi:hypothetical protein
VSRTSRLVAMIVVLLIAGACKSPTPTESDVPAGAIRVTGTVAHYSLEGGFWAVRGDDGVTYDPMAGLPGELQQEGLRIVMTAKVRTDLAGTHMVGPIVEVLEIHRL